MPAKISTKDSAASNGAASAPVDLPRLTSWRGNILTASLTINVLSLALPIVILQIYDRIIPNDSVETLVFLIIGLAIVLVVDGLLRTARSYLAGWAGARFEHEAGCRAVGRLLKADLRAAEADAVGVQLDRLGAIDTLRDFYSSQGPLVLVDLPFVLLFVGLIYWIAGPLVAVPVALFGLIAIVAVLAGHRLRQAIRARSEMDERRYNFIIELLVGIHTIKAMAMETLMLRRYERLLEGNAKCIYDVTFYANMSQGIGFLSSQVTMVAVSAAGSLLVLNGQLTVGGLAACTLLAGRTMQPLLRAMGIWRQFQATRVGRDRLAEIYALAPEAPPSAKPMPEIKGAIELDDVYFRYDETAEAPWLLEGVSLKIEPGETIGIRGGNGVGKSSLLWLIAGALRPQQGRVLFDGTEIADRDPQSLRRQIAYLPQRGVLFDGTLLDNLTMFDAAAPAERTLEISRALGLDRVIARLPQGFDTPVGDSSTETLPGGVRQLIAIARGLLDDRRVVLFDEANTLLDHSSDEQLRRRLAQMKGTSTMVLISFRPSILKLADRVFDLSDGKLNPSTAASADLPSKALELSRQLERDAAAGEAAAMATRTSGSSAL